MTRPLRRTLLSIAGVLCMAAVAWGFPKPSPYPISWELKFRHSEPKRVVVRAKDDKAAEAFWYMTYTVSNPGPEERRFLPVFEMLTEDGKVIRSDRDIPPVVLDTIRLREKTKLLSATEIGGDLKVGEDEAKDGVVIWREPDPKMSQFTIYATGLSGESVILKDDKGNDMKKPTADGKGEEPVVVRKTLQLRYHLPGDDRYPGTDVVEAVDAQWVMR